MSTAIARADNFAIATMTTEELRDELVAALKITAESLSRLALIVQTLEERGDDLSGLRIPLLDHLRRIAHGQVLPELVVRFAGKSMLLHRVSLLPMPDQQRLANGGTVELVVRRDSPDGENTSFDKRQADPQRMTPKQVCQVFANDHIRGEGEQILLLEDKRSPTKSASPRGKVRTDKQRGGLLVGRVFVTHAEVLEGLSMLRDKSESQSGKTKTLVVTLAEEEHRQIKVRADQSGVSMTDLVRRALQVAGLI